ncbi:MAG: hypothetical protein LBM04_07555 [Opitutaceae bacterium]|nr:hypothetical protein [Opitutaceae bacterium]
MIRALYTLIIMSFSLQMACYSNIAQPRTPQEMEEMSEIIFEGTIISVELIKIDEIPVPGNTPIIINNYAALVKMSLLLKGTLDDTDIIVHFFEIKDARYRGEKGTMLHPGDKNRFYMDHNSIGKKADGGIIFTISGRRNLIHTDSRQKIADSILNNEVESSMLDQDIARITTTGEINVPVYKDSDVESSKNIHFQRKQNHFGCGY